MTCHDGFTLNDLVSFNEKHNERNGEGNRDGANDNESWNCGYEGFVELSDLPDEEKEAIEALRRQQIKNFLTLLFLSQGTPMLLYGDEMRRTAEGDNNTVFQDNHLNWINWENTQAARRDPPVHQADHRLPQAAQDRPPLALPDGRRDGDADPPEHHLARREAEPGRLLGRARGSSPGSSRRSRPRSAPTCRSTSPRTPSGSRSTIELPETENRRWYRVVDTSLPAGEDIVPEEEAFFLPEMTYVVRPRSTIVLVAR